MSLRWYRMPRLVVLSSNTPVLEAARAIENNNIGAIVVQEGGRVAGILTDRDLAIRVVGRDLDPKSTPLSEVMSTPVVTLTPADSQSQAAQLMRQRNIRRIPLMENGKLVGIVTLDDLILDEGAPPDQVAAVVQSQISQGGPAPSVRSPAVQRRVARAQATYGRLLNQLREAAELDTADEAETALEIVLESLVRRLVPGGAANFIAQLPSLIQPPLRELLPGPDRAITRQSIELELGERLNRDAASAAQILEIVGCLIAQSVSPGQVQDVRDQLPEDLRAILPDLVAVGS